jgi:hypothetical protein
MDVCANSKPEGSKRNGEGDVQGRRARRVVQPKALVRNVSRESNGAHYPRRQAPRLHVSGRYREHDANEGVPDTEEKDRSDPRLTR